MSDQHMHLAKALNEWECPIHKTEAEKDSGNCGYALQCLSCGRQFIGHKGDQFGCPNCRRVWRARNAVIEAAKEARDETSLAFLAYYTGNGKLGNLVNAVDELIEAEKL